MTSWIRLRLTYDWVTISCIAFPPVDAEITFRCLNFLFLEKMILVRRTATLECSLGKAALHFVETRDECSDREGEVVLISDITESGRASSGKFARRSGWQWECQ